MEHQDQQFAKYVVESIVEYPDKVFVERSTDEQGVLITISVAQEDMSKVIGRMGNIVKAIRILLRVVGAKNNARVSLKINEPHDKSN